MELQISDVQVAKHIAVLGPEAINIHSSLNLTAAHKNAVSITK